jgi:phage-related protein
MLSNILNFGKDLINKVFAGTKQRIIKETKDFAANQAQSLSDQAEQLITPAVKVIKQGLFEKTADIAHDISKRLNSIISDVFKFLGLSSKNMLKATRNFAKSITKFLYEIARALAEVINLIVSKILGVINDFLSTLLGAVFHKLSPEKTINECTSEARACLVSAQVNPSLAVKPSQEKWSKVEQAWENVNIFDNEPEQIMRKMAKFMNK